MPERRRMSELLIAYQSFESLRNAIVFEERGTAADDGTREFAEVVEELIRMTKERAEGSQV